MARAKPLTYACLCGLSIRFSRDGEQARKTLAMLLNAHHQGEGHGQTDPRTAYRARQKAEAVGPEER